jgi:ABC-type Zn uptake system ZnuABC Zn-binding protein ZnuA
VRRAAARFVCVLALALVALPASSGPPLRVVATTADLASLVEAVGGNRVAVEYLAPALADPHAVDVKPAQVARLRDADLLVRIGLDHEPWLAGALRAAGNPRIARGGQGDVDASHGVALLQAETPRLRADVRPHSHALGNPHYWLDPENGRAISATIQAALARASPGDRAVFEANRARFLERLDAGLARWRAALAPWRDARVVVVHETWTYFAARFAFTIVASAEPAPGVPPTPSELAALIARMRSGSVALVIGDPYSDPQLLRQLAERSGARAATLVPSVGGDAEARDYIALFDLNVKRVAAALKAP